MNLDGFDFYSLLYSTTAPNCRCAIALIDDAGNPLKPASDDQPVPPLFGHRLRCSDEIVLDEEILGSLGIASS